MDYALSTVLHEYDQLLAEEDKKRISGTLMPKEGQRDERSLAVGPQTGQLINLLARSLDQPTILEIGTSYGYSTIWLADAARASGGKVITMEHWSTPTAARTTVGPDGYPGCAMPG